MARGGQPANSNGAASFASQECRNGEEFTPSMEYSCMVEHSVNKLLSFVLKKAVDVHRS